VGLERDCDPGVGVGDGVGSGSVFIKNVTEAEVRSRKRPAAALVAVTEQLPIATPVITPVAEMVHLELVAVAKE
jgi:hypothetical protein